MPRRPVEISRSVQDRYGDAAVLGTLATIYLDANRNDEALGPARQALPPPQPASRVSYRDLHQRESICVSLQPRSDAVGQNHAPSSEPAGTQFIAPFNVEGCGAFSYVRDDFSRPPA